MTKHRIAPILMSVIALFSCSDRPSNSDPPTPKVDGASFPHSILTTPSDFVDPSGRQWLWIGAAKMAAAGGNVEDSSDRPEAPPIDYASLTPAERREKIARKMMPIRVIAGNVYTLAAPDYALVDQVLAMNVVPSTDGHEGTLNQAPTSLGVDLHVQPKAIFHSPEARGRATTPTAQWYASQAKLLFAGCTAVLIGTTTALTAAHCMYDPDGDQYFDLELYPGFNLVNGSFVYASPGPYLPVQGWFTAGWYYDADRDWDYGVLDFYGPPGTGTSPGYDWGWYGTHESTSDSVGWHYLLGYPIESKPNGEQWGSWSCCAISTFSSSRRFYHYLDQEKGNSGGCIYETDAFGVSRCFGIVSTGSLNYAYNTARRWNSDTYNFVHAYAHWP